MSQANATQQTDLEAAADGDHKDAVVELNDDNGTVLREGDVLANTRTDEKLIVLGFNEEIGSIEYYSNHEQEEGLHEPRFIPSCFDAIFRTVDDKTEIIELSPS
jgi:hypothetical protein